MKAVLITLIALLIALPVSAQNDVTLYQGENTLYRDTVWQGIVEVDGILTVAPGVTLEIRPGTEVRFTFADTNDDGIGEHELFVQGVLRAVGTDAEPIRFTSAQSDPRPGAWGAINMMSTEVESLLDHCDIEYAYRGFHAHFSLARLRNTELHNNVRAAQFQESTVIIENCGIYDNFNGIQFRDSEVTIRESAFSRNLWGARCVYSTVKVEDCLVEQNLINGMNFRGSQVTFRRNLIRQNRKGIYLQDSSAQFVDNQLLGNSEHGILLENTTGEIKNNLVTMQGRAGVKVVDSTATLSGNKIVANGEYALINEGRTDFNAQGNWWGETDPALINILIRDRSDRSEVGIVDFSSSLGVSPVLSFER